MPDRPLPERPLPDSPPIDSPDGATPPSAWDETLMRAIDAGQLDASQAADAKLAGAFAAHQKLESLFAALRGQPDTDPNTQPEPAPTQLGRYVIGAGAATPGAAILGAGAFGTVYLAHDPELNRDVAIKVSSRSLGKTARARADAIATEARHAASLNHPGIVTIHDVGRDGERLFIVMQYIRGQTLEQRLRAGSVPPARAAELLAAVADALHYAHKRGFVHRDLKPANILLDERGVPHVADFGLAVSEETQRALGGQVAGTPEYMAPEQIRGESHRLDGRTDVWALGVILYELLAGRRPFAGQTTRVVLDEIEHRDPKPPRQINDVIPAELERICLKCLAKRMTDRYSTAADLAADLRDFQSRRNLPALSAESGRGGESNLLPLPSGVGRGEGVPARLQTSSPAPPPAVIPQGLRSFDGHDADFFLQLLPGPRDRDGLPESLRFWKTRVEQTDADATFAVGLIYGPSGCGKSSLVKAGLLPRLAPHVLPVYLEATADDTEARLLKALRKRSPELTARDLVGAIAELRAGEGLAAGRKLLIVLDQFEQWLHAHPDPQPTELVRAIRQCDGARVQCVVTVRDDFWLSASRFIQALEIPLVERGNSALVDLFDPLHARNVLALFGRAYGRLPAQGELSAEQSRFIEQAVAELAEAGKVVSVRLALFAEMVKGKPWTPATLKDTGGIAGVGVTFLEEAFSATTAAPRHRLHQKAAQEVLKALLPDAGSDLKGHRRSRDQLLSISGYTHRPAEFAELLRILDAELRLVTPADEELARDDPSIQNAKSNSQPSYQLTHDYLVPSLRDWLTRKQRETRRGRAELRLAERAAAYAAAPDPRHLPGWWEWPNILFFAPRRAWNAAERRVMRAAGRRRGLQAALVAVLLVAGAFAGREARRRVNEDRDRVKANGIVQRLLEAPLASVPADAAELQPYRHWTDAKLRQVLADDSNSNADQRLRASVGLLDVDAEQAKPIYEAMLNASPEDARVLVGILKPHGSEFVERLWQLVANREAAPSPRLRAAMALAAFTSANAEQDRWLAAAPFIVDQIVAEARQDPSQYEPLVAGLAPAVEALLPALGAVFRDSARNSTERELAPSIVAKYAAGDPRVLVDFINDAQPEQFSIIFPALEKHGDAAIGLLAAELDKHATFNWHDPPLDPSWQRPAEATIAQIEAAGGMLAERFALVQTLPLNDFSDLADELRASGYRPFRCRPYAAGDQIQVAGVWTRDALNWKSALDLTADEVLARNAQLQKEGYLAEVAGYTTTGGARFAALWTKVADDGNEWRVYVDLAGPSPPGAENLTQDAFGPAKLHAYTSPDGSPHYALVWRKGVPDWQWIADTPPGTYEAAAATDRLQVDVSLRIATPPPVKKLDAVAALEAADKAAAAKPDDLIARFARGIARYYSGDDPGALEDLTFVVEKASESAGNAQRRSELRAIQAVAHGARAHAHSRLKHADEARFDVKTFAELGGPPSTAAFIDAVVSARLGDPDASLARLEKTVGAHSTEVSFLYDAAGAYSLVAGLLADDPEKAAQLSRRAVDLLRQAVMHGFDNLEQIRTDVNFENLRESPAFQDLLTSAHLEHRYAAVFETNAMYVSLSPHGLDPEQHLTRCRELAEEGYRPAAISVAQSLEANAPTAGTALVAASVWRLPRVEDREKEVLAKRHANAAATLARLGHGERVWPLLRHAPDPRLRSWLVHRLGPLGVEPKLLIERLFAPRDVLQPASAAVALADRTSLRPGAAHSLTASVGEEKRPSATDDVLFDPETSIRRALLLALGEFDETRLPPTERVSLLDKLLERYRSDPDAGIHAAVVWLVRRWGGEKQLAEVDGALRDDKRANGDRKWYVNSQGQTMVVVAGPAEFLMGSPGDEPGRQIDEPLHKRRIDRSFAVASHEVTVDQIKRWRPAFSYGLEYSPTGSCPMNGVSWYEAAEYCNWLSDQEGLKPCYEQNPQGRYAEGMRPAADYLLRDGYRLPTEAEWEFACRAGATTRYYYGASEAVLGHYACYEANSKQRMFEVGSLKPNDFGLFDMHGNASEWCGDGWAGASAHRRLDRPGNDVADVSPLSDTTYRMSRGGSYSNDPSFVRAAHRSRDAPVVLYTNFGFRVARTLPHGPRTP